MRIIGWFISHVIYMLLRGLILTYVWGLYVVPIFAVPVLTVVQAIGFSLTVSLLTLRLPTERELKEDSDSIWFHLTYGVLVHLSVLFLAWFWSLYL